MTPAKQVATGLICSAVVGALKRGHEVRIMSEFGQHAAGGVVACVLVHIALNSHSLLWRNKLRRSTTGGPRTAGRVFVPPRAPLGDHGQTRLFEGFLVTFHSVKVAQPEPWRKCPQIASTYHGECTRPVSGCPCCESHLE